MVEGRPKVALPVRCTRRATRRLVLVQLGPDPSPKAPAGMVQTLGRISTGSPQACSSARRASSGIHEGLAGSAPVRRDADAMPSLDAAAEAVLISVDTLEPVWCEVAHACPLIRITEDAGYAAQPRAAQPIYLGRNDSMATSIFHTSDSRSTCTGRQ